MRKLLILASVSLFSFAAVAAPTVKITSYTYINNERKTAELCGVVSDMTTTPTFVQVIVDESSKRPATYNTLVGADGNFCAVVITYYGTAIARTF